MKRLKSSTVARFAFFAIVSYGMIYRLLGNGSMFELASSLVLGTSVALAITWFPAASTAVRSRIMEEEGIFAIGLWGIFCALAVQRVYSIALRGLGRPDWLANSWEGPFITWLLFVFCAVALLAPGTKRGDVPGRNWLYVIIGVAAGGLVAGISIGYLAAQILN